MTNLQLTITKRTDPRLLERMEKHYSQPKGFVGRNICYAVTYDGIYYGHIVAGSATRFLPNRNEYLGINLKTLNNVINNIFFNIEKIQDKYPIRNFSTEVIKTFMQQSAQDWEKKYKDKVFGFETLVELPRTGNIYKRAGWEKVGQTKGYTCKRIGGNGGDGWTGQRVWNTDKNSLKPKIVLCCKYGIIP